MVFSFLTRCCSLLAASSSCSWLAASVCSRPGLVRAKNTTMQLTKNVALFSIAAVGYYIIGYNLMYPLGTWSVDGILSGVIGVAVLEAVGVAPEAADDPVLCLDRFRLFLPADVLCGNRLDRVRHPCRADQAVAVLSFSRSFSRR